MVKFENDFKKIITRLEKKKNLKVKLTFYITENSKFSYKIENGSILLEIGDFDDFKYNFIENFEFKSIGSI